MPPKSIHKAAWTSTDGKTKNQIDHVLISKRFRNSVKDIRVYRSTDIGSDHYLVCTTEKFRLKRAPRQRTNNRVKYETSKLRDEDVLKAFNITLKNRYQILEQEEEVSGEDHREVERDFEVMRKAYTKVADAVLAKPRKKKKPWISEESWRLVGQREATNKKILDTRSERLEKKLTTKYVEENKEVKKEC